MCVRALGVLGRQSKRAGRLTAVYYRCITYMYTCICVCVRALGVLGRQGKRAGRLTAVARCRDRDAQGPQVQPDLARTHVRRQCRHAGTFSQPQ